MTSDQCMIYTNPSVYIVHTTILLLIYTYFEIDLVYCMVCDIQEFHHVHLCFLSNCLQNLSSTVKTVQQQIIICWTQKISFLVPIVSQFHPHTVLLIDLHLHHHYQMNLACSAQERSCSDYLQTKSMTAEVQPHLYACFI